MASFIPRLEWNDVSVVGNTTSGNPTIVSIPSTTLIKVNMIINHANFPAGAYVLSKTSTTLTMSANATVTATAATLPLFERFDFTYPSDAKNIRPQYYPSEQISESIGGTRQVQINNIIKKVALDFKFIPKAKIDILEADFYLAWAVYGKSFRYFQSYEVNSSEDYELDAFDFKAFPEIPKQGDFLYKIAFKFRRVHL